ncbi:MFS transporter [uncultured Lactobacillus sp.]|uniref:MFS transporter n=1 Tax=uncultured Lactobacillus sp. TaxID=153152 RepID=UPI0025EFE565|nr:MFS transporter [uncultured Lactobacillus sp.]
MDSNKFLNRNQILLPLINLLSNFGSILVGIGGSLIIREYSDNIVVNGLISSISSLALILSVLFIGSRLDNVDKRRMLIWIYIFLCLFLLLPFSFPKIYFIPLYILVDLCITMFSLVEGLSFTGTLKSLLTDKSLEKTINYNSIAGLIGNIASVAAIAILILTTHNYLYFLLVASSGFFINIFLSLALHQRHFIKDKNNFKTITHLIKVWHEIITSKGLRAAIIVAMFNGALQSVFNGLMIYFWKVIDPKYSQVYWLLFAVVSGLFLGAVLIRFDSHFWLLCTLVIITTLALCLIGISTAGILCTLVIITTLALGIFFLKQTIATMFIGTVLIYGETLPIGNWCSKVRIKRTSKNVQSAQSSFLQLGSALLNIFFTVGVSAIANGLTPACSYAPC